MQVSLSLDLVAKYSGTQTRDDNDNDNNKSAILLSVPSIEHHPETAREFVLPAVGNFANCMRRPA